MSVIEPSFAMKRRNGYQTGRRQLALRPSLRPQLELWLGRSESYFVQIQRRFSCKFNTVQFIHSYPEHEASQSKFRDCSLEESLITDVWTHTYYVSVGLTLFYVNFKDFNILIVILIMHVHCYQVRWHISCTHRKQTTSSLKTAKN